MGIKVTFSDLTHTGQVVAANTFPFGAALVASHAKKVLGDAIDVELFKYPEDLARSIDDESPQVAAFSCYLWNVRLAHAFAAKLKQRAPGIVIIFGGPNFPVDESEQKRFLAQHPAIDFYVYKEGEQACAGLLKRLFELNWDAKTLRDGGEKLPSVHYLRNGEHVFGPLMERLPSLALTPSPYRAGLMDKFFDGVLIPMIETNRGCPFQCNFCIEGTKYYNKVRWEDHDNIRADLDYISERTTNPDLLITDSNFGMYKEDLKTCRLIAEYQSRKGWPRYVQNSSGKNQKERVLEAARILNGAMILTVSIQSADEAVLRNVRRSNISVDQIIEIGKQAELTGANSYCEIILGLPGDSRDGHFRSVQTMVDADINDVLTYQTMMLPGTDIETRETRRRHGMQTRWRTLPRCFGVYEILGDRVPIAEVEEICVANDTLAFEDYLACRSLSLSVELFHNSGVFAELAAFLKLYGVKRSQFVRRCHELASATDSSLRDIFDGYMRENQDKLWQDRAALAAWLVQPGIIERHVSGELGSGELYKYRAMAFFLRQQDMHDIAFAAACDLLHSAFVLTPEIELYLAQLARYSLLRKTHLTETDRGTVERFDFDFVSLEGNLFKDDPLNYRIQGGVTIRIDHDDGQRELIAAYLKQYGTSINGLGRLLLRSHVNKLYRRSEVIDAAPGRI
ncbi:MAG: hypothetical protein A3G18_02560 [Rhodospirillales bacterium RIFCSPLOWO2_12_FULL_58_28]|nr:MAG: hypothetical protein A3H92_06680 [Rhodospirillales bacterium RIFCSPLOWO2_02_FULL_58_16]OHC78933.1 MAG: hypothetical protein A3G18_02560 [Rhodospirillales bacterium RIFCSPLOWO2_12_FULL_58_28]